HTLKLDVDDAAGTATDRLGSPLQSVGGLVKANRSRHLVLESSQTIDVVGRHRLLEHQEVLIVELPENVDVRALVRRVGIDHERDVAEVLPDRAGKLDVAAGLDLDLDPTVTLREMGFDRLEQLD